MKTVLAYLSIGAFLLTGNACKHPSPDVAPTALDSVGVVGTFVSFKGLMFNQRVASITALAVDSAGNVYATDPVNHVIRKISPAGKVETYAGTGETGYRNGVAAEAQFSDLVSLAFDKAGNLYAGEGFDNTCIRKITPTGQVSTFAGKPFDIRALPFIPDKPADGPDTSALFITPIALTFNSTGTLFVSDAGSINRYASNAIRRVTPDGYVRTIAGYVSGMPYKGQIVDNSPYPFRFISLTATKKNDGLVGIDRQGLLYQITATGDMSVPVYGKSFGQPTVVLYDRDDNLLVSSASTIWRLTPGGQVSVLTGSAQRGFVNDSLKSARFGYINALAIDKNNTLYISDQSNQCIRRVRLN